MFQELITTILFESYSEWVPHSFLIKCKVSMEATAEIKKKTEESIKSRDSNENFEKQM